MLNYQNLIVYKHLKNFGELQSFFGDWGEKGKCLINTPREHNT